VNSILNLRVPQNAGKLLSGLTTGGLSTSAQLHRVNQLVSEYTHEVAVVPCCMNIAISTPFL
jgi:hypothetical protein